MLEKGNKIDGRKKGMKDLKRYYHILDNCTLTKEQITPTMMFSVLWYLIDGRKKGM